MVFIMVHYFKRAGQRIVVDDCTGYAMTVDEITYKMLAYLTPPLPDDCPSAIRYDMAKYDSRLVDAAYERILTLYRLGKLYTEVPFDADRAPTLCPLSSSASPDVINGTHAHVLLCDTDNAENASEICRRAKDAGLSVTVLLTADGVFPCDRLLVPEDRYEAYAGAAPAVGVRFSYDVTAPAILSRVIALADRGITLVDAFPKNPDMRRAGEQTALIKELERTAKELFLRKKEGRPVDFLPFSIHGMNAKHGTDAHCAPACITCSHRMICGGIRLSDADCEIKRSLADSAVMLSIC